jgi:hypothetical protein
VSRPAVFIGSSSEGRKFALAVQGALQADAEVTTWDQGIFTLGSTFIEGLMKALKRFDFAVLVLTPDDTVQSRSTESLSPRDNVIFERRIQAGEDALALAEAIRYVPGRPLRSATVIVFKKDAGSPCEVDPVVVRRALALAGAPRRSSAAAYD